MALFLVAVVLSVVVVVFGAFFLLFFFFFLFLFFFQLLSDRLRWSRFKMGFFFISRFSNAGRAGGQLDYRCESHCTVITRSGLLKLFSSKRIRCWAEQALECGNDLLKT